MRSFWISFFLLLVMGCDTSPSPNQLEPTPPAEPNIPVEPTPPEEPDYKLKQGAEAIQPLTTQLSSGSFELEASVNLYTTELTSAKYRITDLSIRM